MFRFLQFTLLAVAATAFTANNPVLMRQPVVASSTAHHLIMSDEETAAVFEKAKGCMGSECSVDEVDDLLVLLKDTQGSLEERLENVKKLIDELDHLNEKKERKADEVRAFVKDMLRVFSTNVESSNSFCQFAKQKPAFSPMGYSGDVGKGPSTAYDSLPPKKWKKPTA
eukprot:scaffold743_cov117-Cylindrotheca_fusiformis.AAC.3